MKIQNETKYQLGLGLLVALTSLVFSFIIAIHQLIKIDNMVAQVDGEYVYYNLQLEDNPFDVEIEQLDNLYHELSGRFIYYEMYRQYLECVPGETSFEGIDESGIINCMQISMNVQNDFEITLASGRQFTKDDFLFHNNRDPIPVILGAAHSNYKIGDVFSCHYLFDNYNFYVIGFLEPNSSISTGDMCIPLDTYIIMPSFNLNLQHSVSDGQRIHYANKTSGIIKVPLHQSAETYDHLQALLDGCGEYSINCSSFNIHMKNKYGIGLTSLCLVAGIAGLFFLFFSVMMAFVQSKNNQLRSLLVFYIVSFGTTAALYIMLMAFVIRLQLLYVIVFLVLQYIAIALITNRHLSPKAEADDP